MCFSAGASFAAAGGLAIVGALSLRAAPSARVAPFAAIPAIFAAHQAIEGFIWLNLDAGSTPPAVIVAAWLLIAQFLWPILIPVAISLIEDNKEKRFSFFVFFAVGVFVCAVLTAIHSQYDFSVTADHGHIVYATPNLEEVKLQPFYFLAVAGPLLISKYRLVQLFGVVNIVGSVVASVIELAAVPSIWCFFAAIGSVLIYLQVRGLKRSSQEPALLPATNQR